MSTYNKPRDLREKTTAELTRSLNDIQKKLSELYFDLAAGRVKNVKEAASLRRATARIRTLLGERVQ